MITMKRGYSGAHVTQQHAASCCRARQSCLYSKTTLESDATTTPTHSD
jgi:hypothetical protein